jgi:hypothetical protein
MYRKGLKLLFFTVTRLAIGESTDRKRRTRWKRDIIFAIRPLRPSGPRAWSDMPLQFPPSGRTKSTIAHHRTSLYSITSINFSILCFVETSQSAHNDFVGSPGQDRAETVENAIAPGICHNKVLPTGELRWTPFLVRYRNFGTLSRSSPSLDPCSVSTYTEKWSTRFLRLRIKIRIE